MGFKAIILGIVLATLVLSTANEGAWAVEICENQDTINVARELVCFEKNKEEVSICPSRMEEINGVCRCEKSYQVQIENSCYTWDEIRNHHQIK